MSEWQWVAGMIAVEAVVTAGAREVKAIHSTFDRFDSRMARLNKLARARSIPIETATAADIEALTGATGHGGIAAEVGPRVMSPLDDLLVAPAPVIVMLDGVEDPYNFGQAVRAFYAAGIDGLIVRPRNWLSAGPAIRASAGATEFMPTAEVESPEAAAAALRPRGLRVAVATVERATPMGEADLTGPLFLVIGGEKRGITRSFERTADLRVSVPYGRDFPHALGTATAATALAFEILRQRRA